MAKQSNSTVTPRLRFPEFREAAGWAVSNLASVASFISDKIPVSRLQPNDYVSTENLLADYGGIVPAAKLPDIASVTHYRCDDVLISNIRPYLKKVWRANQDGGASNDVIVVRAKPLLSQAFLSLTLRNDAFIAYVMRSAKGVKMPRGDVNSMREYPLAYPGFVEQQKITDCLTSLEEVIAAQGQKVEALKAHKRGLMQQLFPREGETRPRLRFPEFRDAPDWEEKKLSALIDLVSGMHLSPDQYSSSGDVPYFTGPSDFTNDVERVTKWTISSSSVAMRHDTLITVKGSGVGECWYLEMPSVAMGRQLMAVRSKASSSQFINQFLLTKKVRFEDLASGNLIPGLTRGDILDMVAPFPKTEEQQRIADCLSSLDAQITAESNQLVTLKTHKQGLMQQLFPASEADRT